MSAPDAFREFERAGWADESLALAYHRQLADATRQSIPQLFAAVAPKAGDRVLGGLWPRATQRSAVDASCVAASFCVALLHHAQRLQSLCYLRNRHPRVTKPRSTPHIAPSTLFLRRLSWPRQRPRNACL